MTDTLKEKLHQIWLNNLLTLIFTFSAAILGIFGFIVLCINSLHFQSTSDKVFLILGILIILIAAVLLVMALVYLILSIIKMITWLSSNKQLDDDYSITTDVVTLLIGQVLSVFTLVVGQIVVIVGLVLLHNNLQLMKEETKDNNDDTENVDTEEAENNNGE